MSEIILKQVPELKPYEKNAKKHSSEQIKKVANSIKAFGFKQPLVIDSSGIVVVGHGRLEAAKLLKMKEVPCIIADDLSKDQIKAYRLADNKLNESDWNMDLVEIELKDLSDDLIELTGFDDDLTIEPEKKDADEIPPPVSVAVAKVGDVYKLGIHRLMCGDSYSPDDVKKLLNGKEIGMVYTDPPYGISLIKDGERMGKGKKYNAIIGDDKQFDPEFLFKYSPNVFVWGGNYYAHKLPPSSCWIVWDKQGGEKHIDTSDCEIAWCNVKKPARVLTHIWDGFRRDSEKGVEREHPTQKPVKILVDSMALVSAPNVILDLFGGSGSTLLACEQTDRICFMMELEPVYVDVIIKRWEKFTGEKAQKLK